MHVATSGDSRKSNGSDSDLLLTQNGKKSVLLIGSSLDRMASAVLCRNLDHFFKSKDDKVCYRGDISVDYVHIRGVGIKGNLRGPYYFYPTKGDLTTAEIINNTYNRLKGSPPDLVVVDSSLWDLANWATRDLHVATEERIQRWCDHDIPLLLQYIADRFGTAKTVFRTAPAVRHEKLGSKGKMGQVKLWKKATIEGMYNCIQSKMQGDKLFGLYKVIDYHKIIADATNSSTLPPDSMYLGDGIHPTPQVTRLYADAILAMLGSDDRTTDADVTQRIAGGTIAYDDDSDL